MKIGLYNLERNIFNTAMMQVSEYHKSKGDEIEMYSHLFHKDYDKIYAFSIFDFTDKGYVCKDMICGGTGFDIIHKLPEEIQQCDYDWTIFPKCEYSILWFSRGCVRNCPWCVVRQKEGYIYPVKPKNLNPNGTHIKVMDNNFFANPDWKDAIRQLHKWNQSVDFQGVDARLLNKEKCDALNSFKHYRQIHIAWDNPKENFIPVFKEILKHIKAYKLMCYVLIGYNSTKEEDIFRVESLRKLKIDPFVMPFNKKNPYQRHYARYVNKKQIFKSCTWEEYKQGKL